MKFINQTGEIVSSLKYCEITNGIKSGVDSSGGGIFLESANILLDHILIHDNIAGGYGGGMYMRNSSPILDYVDFYDNTAHYDGGGFFCNNSSPIITKSLIVGNSTQWEGGGFACFAGSQPEIYGATISDNSAMQNGPAIATLYDSRVTLVNCIVYENYIDVYLSESSEIYIAYSGEVLATYCDIRNGIGESYFGDTCFDDDPLLDNNYELLATSPCIDAGNPAPQYDDPDGSYADIGRFYHAQAGIRGYILIEPEAPEDLIDEVIIKVFQENEFEEMVFIDSSLVNSNGTYYVELGAGEYTVKCEVNYYGFAATPIMLEATVIEDQLTTLDDFMISAVAEGTAQGQIEIFSFDMFHTELYQSIVISSDAPGSGEVSPYRVYNQAGFLLYWEYSLDLD